MAGDWIKMRVDLQTHPKVVRIMSETDSDKFRVIGGLHAVWAVFDAHSEDGVLHGYTPQFMDTIIGWEGFSEAMIAVGWLEYDGNQVIVMPSFSEHNGKSGKRRAEDAKRKREARKASAKCPQNVRSECGLEKRREEKSNNPPVVPPGDNSPTKKRRSGSRLPDDWTLPPEWRQWAIEETPQVDPVMEAEKFRDFWHSAAGAKGRKADWFATWRNWCRRAVEQLPTSAKAATPDDFWQEVQ